MKTFIVSMVGVKQRPGTTNVEHAAVLIEAHSPEEAEGKGMRYARWAWPQDHGFGFHHVTSRPADKGYLKPEAEWRRL